MRSARRSWWPLLCLVLAWGCGAPTARPPNILMILADDLGWNDVGYHGSRIETPRIDALAATGVELDQFYTQPLCSAARASLMTGRYPIRQGLQMGVVRPWADFGLPLTERTLANALKEVGYDTAILGKWHLGMIRAGYLPTQRGFDHHYGHYGGAIDYFDHSLYYGLDWHRNEVPVEEEGYSTDLLAREAERLIAAHDTSRPLFLYLSFNAPHKPLQARPGDTERYADLADPDRRTYAAMVTALDEAVGRVVDALEARGMMESTLIAFASDNGGEPVDGADNSPLRGGKGTAYEGGIRVPAFITWRGVLPEGGVVREPLHMIDLYPTLLARAGASLQQTLPLDGRDAWLTIAEAAPTPHDEILLDLSAARGVAAIRRGDWKLIMTGRGKPHERKELFDLRVDPEERADLATAHPDIVRELEMRIDHYAAQVRPAKLSSVDLPPNFRVPRVWEPLPESLPPGVDPRWDQPHP